MYHVDFVFIDEIQCIFINCLRVGLESTKYVVKRHCLRGGARFYYERFLSIMIQVKECRAG
jgi:hypothetical protein